eukprot:GILJ01017902.1.p1 GENE.GILJ01017902.1~~GILJ01017902.1.p1  ORF type:complete len:745 (-),score=102.47 GILJ01017902.1:134-2368(-)
MPESGLPGPTIQLGAFAAPASDGRRQAKFVGVDNDVRNINPVPRLPLREPPPQQIPEAQAPEPTATTEAQQQAAQGDEEPLPLGSGVNLDFKDVRYSVFSKPGKFKDPVEKEILHGISGYCHAGQFIALLGPSGAGKSTLLNVLSNRYKRNVKGEILLNGEPLEKGHRAVLGYVRQEDVFFGNLTVREALNYSVRLRCGHLSKARKKKYVDYVLNSLSLNKSADTIIGDELTHGISGGERKRLSIGIELVTDPAVLFLDEPTSGLDAHLSYSLISQLNYLKNLAKGAHKARTLVATIHQPSSFTLELFDAIMILSAGRVIYFGPPQNAMDYFQTKFDVRFHEFGNPADAILDLASLYTRESEPPNTTNNNNQNSNGHNGDSNGNTNGNNGDNSNESSVRRRRRRAANATPYVELEHTDLTWQMLVEAWRNEGDKEVVRTIESTQHGTPIDISKEAYKAHRPSYLTQVKILSYRAFILFFRDTALFRARIIQSIFTGLLVGFVFFQLDYTQLELRARTGATFVILFLQSVFPLFNALNSFAVERVVIFHERAGKWYQMSPYVIAKIFSEFPLHIIEPILFGTIAWWLTSVNTNFWRYLGMLSALILSYLTGNAVGLFLAAVTPSVAVALILGSVVMLLLVLFAGFFVPLAIIPPELAWIQWISFLRYSFELALGYVFVGQTYTCLPDEFIGGICPFTTGEQYLASFGITSINYARCYGLLVAMMVAFRIGTYFAVRFYKPKELRR